MKKERGGLLARQRQIAELEVEVARLAEQMEQQNGQLDQYYAQTGQKKDEIATLRGQDEAFIRRAAQLEQQLNQQEKETSRLSRELELERFNLEEQQTLLQEQQTALAAETVRQVELKEQETQLAQQSDSLEQQQQRLQQQQKKQQEANSQDRIQLATAQQRWQMLAQQAADEAQRLAALQQTLQAKERNRTSWQNGKASMSKRLPATASL